MARVVSVTLLRWVARAWSIASVGLPCAFLFGEGLPPLTPKAVLFPFGVMLGLILAWWFERLGGIVAALSVLLFYALEYSGHGRLPKGPWFFLIAAPSLIFILCGYMKARKMNDQVAEPGVPGDA